VQYVAPKRAALAAAEEMLAEVMGALNEKKAALKKVEDELGTLQQQFDDATQKKIDLENQVGRSTTPQHD
jgi:dynein heavy chain